MQWICSPSGDIENINVGDVPKLILSQTKKHQKGYHFVLFELFVRSVFLAVAAIDSR